MRLFARCMKEDVYVVDRQELEYLTNGHLERNLEKKNPCFQVFRKDGETVETLTAMDLVEDVLSLKSLALIEHNGKAGGAGHFAAFARRGAAPDVIRKLNEQHHAQRKPDKSKLGGRPATMATLRPMRTRSKR